ncbi:MAG: T9SS type A sorting domain-containing protein [Saprospiraceae bacterium]|nr:T9SS type A sorting domain-containing protein [Saprospiraceae bacterium]MBP7679986.1 T9SS type A sorting domain-containing protein [Saprospiraceae bacterium]
MTTFVTVDSRAQNAVLDIESYYYDAPSGLAAVNIYLRNVSIPATATMQLLNMRVDIVPAIAGTPVAIDVPYTDMSINDPKFPNLQITATGISNTQAVENTSAANFFGSTGRVVIAEIFFRLPPGQCGNVTFARASGAGNPILTYNATVGNSTLVNAGVSLPNNPDFCLPAVTINGNIETIGQSCSGSTNLGVPNTTITTTQLTGSGFPINNVTTNTSGIYNVQVAPSQTYRITPTKTTNPFCGVNGLDADKIQSFVFGYVTTLNMSEWMAADVDRSNKVATYDVALVTKVVNNTCTGTCPGFFDWRFIPSSVYYTYGAIPMGTIMTYPNFKDVSVGNSNSFGSTFVAAKAGDPTQSCTSCGFANDVVDTRQSGQTLEEPVRLSFYPNTLKAGEEQTITLSLSELNEPSIAVLDMLLVNNDLELKSIAISDKHESEVEYVDINEAAFEQGSIRVAWLYNKIVNSHSQTEVLKIHVKAKNTIDNISDCFVLTQSGTDVSSYISHGKIYPFSLGESQTVLSGVTQAFATPNPFTGQTRLNFYVPVEQEITIRLVTVDGKIIDQYKQIVAEGMNTYKVEYPYQGTLLYQIISDKNTLTGKLIAQ